MNPLIEKLIEFAILAAGCGCIFFIGWMVGWSSGNRAKLESIAPPDKDKP